MSLIEEIPINAEENPSTVEEIPTNVSAPEVLEETPVPKKRGRPVGAKSKAPPKPKVKKAPVIIDSEESERRSLHRQRRRRGEQPMILKSIRPHLCRRVVMSLWRYLACSPTGTLNGRIRDEASMQVGSHDSKPYLLINAC